MRRILLASTFLLGFATEAATADINRVWDLCAKRGSCETSTLMSRAAMADLQPAILHQSNAQVQQRNPDPFHQFTQQPPTTQQVQAPTQQLPGQFQQPPTQVLVQAPAPAAPQRDLWDWIMVGLGGLLTTFIGTNVLQGFRKPDFNNPNALRIMALQAAQTGLNSPVVDNLLNFPGEDIVERIANRVIERRLAALGVDPMGVQEAGRVAGISPGITPVPTEKLSGLLDGIESLIQRLGKLNQPGAS